jgi:arylsulfatase A-like enzyme
MAPIKRKALSFALLSAATLALAGHAAADPAADHPAAARPAQPNIVVVVTDDQDSSSFNRKLMPHTFRLMRGGTHLSNFTIATPLCCPSRAAQLTGQYGHNNGVLSNGPGYQALRDPADVLPAWLQRAGYETAHVGRFLNGYKRGDAGPAAPAPGWDHWIGLTHLHYRDYDLSIDGDPVAVRGDGPRQYVTRDLHRRTNDLLRDLSASGRPFYLQLDELAPHSDHLARGVCARSALPGPKLFKGVRGLPGIHLPANPAGESSVADKPAYIARLPRIDAKARDAIQRRMRCRAAAIHEADRGIGHVVANLRHHDELADTVFVFYSDNGFFDGQHRIVKSKGLPYEESIQVPAMIRVPRRYLDSPAPRRVGLPTSNIDVAPTLLDLAGAEPCSRPGDCRRLDGRSLLDALAGDDSWSRDRPILFEVDQRGKVAGGTLACTYSGVRSGGQVFVDYDSVVRHSTRTCRESKASEHYRLARDPHENHNLWPPRTDADRTDQRHLRELMRRLETCSGNTHQPPAWTELTGGPPSNPCE